MKCAIKMTAGLGISDSDIHFDFEHKTIIRNYNINNSDQGFSPAVNEPAVASKQ